METRNKIDREKLAAKGLILEPDYVLKVFEFAESRQIPGLLRLIDNYLEAIQHLDARNLADCNLAGLKIDILYNQILEKLPGFDEQTITRGDQFYKSQAGSLHCLKLAIHANEPLSVIKYLIEVKCCPSGIRKIPELEKQMFSVMAQAHFAGTRLDLPPDLMQMINDSIEEERQRQPLEWHVLTEAYYSRKFRADYLDLLKMAAANTQTQEVDYYVRHTIWKLAAADADFRVLDWMMNTWPHEFNMPYLINCIAAADSDNRFFLEFIVKYLDDFMEAKNLEKLLDHGRKWYADADSDSQRIYTGHLCQALDKSFYCAATNKILLHLFEIERADLALRVYVPILVRNRYCDAARDLCLSRLDDYNEFDAVSVQVLTGLLMNRTVELDEKDSPLAGLPDRHLLQALYYLRGVNRQEQHSVEVPHEICRKKLAAAGRCVASADDLNSETGKLFASYKEYKAHRDNSVRYSFSFHPRNHTGKVQKTLLIRGSLLSTPKPAAVDGEAVREEKTAATP